MSPTVIAPGLDGLVAHFGLSLVDKDGKKITTTTPETKKDNESTTPVGSLCSSVPIYQGEPDRCGRMPWVSDEPEDVPEAAENETTLGHCVVIRYAKSQDSRKKFRIHSLIIQSPQLKKALTSVFDGYPGVSCNLSRLIFTAPFHPFVHRWLEFMEYMNKEHEEQDMKDHLKLLHEILTAELGETFKALDDYVKHGVVTFEHVWTLFAPGTVLVSPSEFGSPLASKCTSGAYGEDTCGKFYNISSQYVDVNGERFCWATNYSRIRNFDGVRPIHALTAMPLSFCPNQAELIRSLINRGRKFEELAGFHYMSYSDAGITVFKNLRGQSEEKIVHLSSRIIVDADAWDTHNGGFAKSLGRLPEERTDNDNNDNDNDSRPSGEDSDTDSFDHLTSGGNHTPASDSPKNFQPLSNTQRMLCAALVRGYSLKLKKWLKFRVDAVSPITWSANAFSSLVLPAQQKELVLALSQTQLASEANAFDDVITGKGRGMILLLNGPPGVGKTLTAESTAEAMRVPLFMMGAGDLGTEAHEVEEKLDGILSLVAKWRAILLIDECDVFLEARSIHDLERNKLVSIFLRLLEYYEGILFLTTNRVKDMDAAFQSRIHLTIAYEELTKEARGRIWWTFLEGMSCETGFSEEELGGLAGLDLNGRQIKNVLKSAQLLAFSKGEALGMAHVDVILGIQKGRGVEARL